MASKESPLSHTVLPWLKAQLGPKCLAPLTSQDAMALAAAVQIIGLFNFCDSHRERAVIEAFGRVVGCMQKSTMHLAYHAIAHATDWHVRSEIWFAAGLPEIPVPRCKYGPESEGVE